MPKLKADQIKISLGTLNGWKRKGGVISRTFTHKDFLGSIKFVNAVAKIAQKADHHPDIYIQWNKVLLQLTTHSEGGLTEKDFVVAAKFDRLTK